MAHDKPSPAAEKKRAALEAARAKEERISHHRLREAKIHKGRANLLGSAAKGVGAGGKAILYILILAALAFIVYTLATRYGWFGL